MDKIHKNASLVQKNATHLPKNIRRLLHKHSTLQGTFQRLEFVGEKEKRAGVSLHVDVAAKLLCSAFVVYWWLYIQQQNIKCLPKSLLWKKV